jgi:hypothetical protein
VKADGSDLGATLVQYAKGPVRKASAFLSAGRVAEGLDAVSHDNLLAGLREGIQETAKRVRIDPREVERVLPWNDLSPILVRITASQRAAMEIWQRHADSVGGLLTGFSGGSVAGEVPKPSAGGYLMALSDRFVRDKHLAQPIKAFAADVLQWEETVERCGDFIDHADLAAGYRRRRYILFGAVASVLLIGLLVGGSMVMRNLAVKASRERVAAAIAGPDPCAVEKIASDDMARALPDQVSRVAALKSACEKGRERAKYEASCQSLASHVEAGRLSSDDEEFLKSNVDIMRRVTRAALDPADFMYPEASMPCQDLPKVVERLWRAYGKAASESTAAWAQADKVSDKLKKLLAEKDLGLSVAAKQELTKRAEGGALKAIVSGKPADLAKAKSLCDFNVTLGVEYGRNCKGVAASMGIRM